MCLHSVCVYSHVPYRRKSGEQQRHCNSDCKSNARHWNKNRYVCSVGGATHTFTNLVPMYTQKLSAKPTPPALLQQPSPSPAGNQRIATPRGARPAGPPLRGLAPRLSLRSSAGVVLTPDSATKSDVDAGQQTVVRPRHRPTTASTATPPMPARSGAATPRPTVATVASTDSGRRTASGASTPRPGSGAPGRLGSRPSTAPHSGRGLRGALLPQVPRLDLSMAASPPVGMGAAGIPTTEPAMEEAAAEPSSMPGAQQPQATTYDRPWRHNMKTPGAAASLSQAPSVQQPTSARTPMSEEQRAALAAYAERKRQDVAEKLRQEREERAAVVYRRVAARNHAAQVAKEQVCVLGGWVVYCVLYLPSNTSTSNSSSLCHPISSFIIFLSLTLSRTHRLPRPKHQANDTHHLTQPTLSPQP